MEQERIKFSPEERETLRIIQDNPTLKNRGIAEMRFVAYDSIGTTLHHIYKKLGFNSGRANRKLLNQWLEGKDL